MKKEDCVLDFKDKDGKRYIFHKTNYKKHCLKHPELLEPEFLNSIKNLICNCDGSMIYKTFDGAENHYCYYEIIATTGQNSSWYKKVVVLKLRNMYIIKTAMRYHGMIRERKYFESLGFRP